MLAIAVPIISRMAQNVDIDFDEIDVSGGFILLCTDGLTNMISEEEICKIITEDFESSADKLVAAANNNGGNDNITALVIKL